jgi:hypothetical protein
MNKKVTQMILFFLDPVIYLYGLLFPKSIINLRYKRIFGSKLNWRNPINLNEKIHWLKFYSDTSQWSILADKYRVREYVKSKGLGHTLNDLYAVYNTAREIDISRLPQEFVLKANNGSGDCLIVKNKNEISNKMLKKHFKNLNKKYGVINGEMHYWKIKPCIIAEKLLVEKSNQGGGGA